MVRRQNGHDVLPREIAPGGQFRVLPLPLLHAFGDGGPDVALMEAQRVSRLRLGDGAHNVHGTFAAQLRGEGLDARDGGVPVLAQPLHGVHVFAVEESRLHLVCCIFELLCFLFEHNKGLCVFVDLEGFILRVRALRVPFLGLCMNRVFGIHARLEVGSLFLGGVRSEM